MPWPQRQVEWARMVEAMAGPIQTVTRKGCREGWRRGRG